MYSNKKNDRRKSGAARREDNASHAPARRDEQKTLGA
jgi:hypothetical protein